MSFATTLSTDRHDLTTGLRTHMMTSKLCVAASQALEGYIAMGRQAWRRRVPLVPIIWRLVLRYQEWESSSSDAVMVYSIVCGYVFLLESGYAYITLTPGRHYTRVSEMEYILMIQSCQKTKGRICGIILNEIIQRSHPFVYSSSTFALPGPHSSEPCQDHTRKDGAYQDQ